MARVTLVEQWDALREQLTKRAAEFARTVIDPLPSVIYHVSTLGQVQEWKITKIDYAFRFGLYYWGRKPTRDDVARLRLYLSKKLAFEPGGILFYWEFVEPTYTESGVVRLGDIRKETYYFFDKEKAHARAAEICAARKLKKDLLAAGHIKCQYCGAIRRLEDIVYKKLINFHQWRGGYSEPRPYCRDKNCAHHDQLAHEG